MTFFTSGVSEQVNASSPASFFTSRFYEHVAVRSVNRGVVLLTVSPKSLTVMAIHNPTQPAVPGNDDCD